MLTFQLHDTFSCVQCFLDEFDDIVIRFYRLLADGEMYIAGIVLTIIVEYLGETIE